jgi:class 3 adenylate cyclase
MLVQMAQECSGMGFIRNSIGLKIFSVASLIVFLMVGITVMNLRVQAQVSHALEQVADRYIAAYGGMADANVRSMEQALYLRRLVIAKILLHDDAIAQTTADDIVLNGRLFDETVANIRTELNLVDTRQDVFADATTLARIDEKLALAQEQQRRYEEDIARLQKQVFSNDVAEFQQALPELGDWRRDFNTHMGETRQLMLEATRNAADNAIQLQQSATRISVIAVLLASLLALAVAAWITHSLVRQVRVLLQGTQSVINGQLDVALPVTTSDEIGHLTHSFNTMTEGLRVGNRVRDIFGKYVDPRIVEDLIEKPQLMSSEGERQIMTVLFCDMQDFTRLSETLTPAALVKLLNRYFTLISEAIHENGGVIDKFIGDAVMAYWGRPFNAEHEQVQRALGAMLTMREKTQQLQNELPQLLGFRTNLPQIGVRAGIATGEAIVGNIGSDRTKNFTVIGDTVNLASRLEGVNKLYGTSLLLTEEAAVMAGELFVLREVDTVVVSGKTEAKKVFTLVGRKGTLPDTSIRLLQHYAQGLAAYRAADWSAAREQFQTCLQINSLDEPSAVMLERLNQFASQPPSADWQGVWLVAQK